MRNPFARALALGCVLALAAVLLSPAQAAPDTPSIGGVSIVLAANPVVGVAGTARTVVTPRARATAAAACTGTATISWGAVTTHTDGTPVTGAINYNAYQGATGAEVIQPALTTSAVSEVVGGFCGGVKVCFKITAQETGGLESAQSNEACKTFPQTVAPAAPTLSVT